MNVIIHSCAGKIMKGRFVLVFYQYYIRNCLIVVITKLSLIKHDDELFCDVECLKLYNYVFTTCTRTFYCPRVTKDNMSKVLSPISFHIELRYFKMSAEHPYNNTCNTYFTYNMTKYLTT